MSETVQPAPDKKELPKWDRSAEGVHRAVGRIAGMLSERVARVADGKNRNGLWHSDLSGDDGYHYNSVETNLPDSESSYKSNSDIGFENIAAKSITGADDKNELFMSRVKEGEGDSSRLKVVTTKDHAKATFDDYRNNTGKPNHSEIINSAMVGDIAANVLNKARGRVAQAELDAKDNMIDFVNNK